MWHLQRDNPDNPHLREETVIFTLKNMVTDAAQLDL